MAAPRKLLLVGALAVTAGALIVLGIGFWLDRQTVAGALHVARIPWSVGGIQCESPFTTDILTTCSFSVGPNDFQALLAGWQFKEIEPEFRSPFDFQSHHHKGPNFLIAHRYLAKPAEFSHGGYVQVLTDLDFRNVLVNYYEE